MPFNDLKSFYRSHEWESFRALLIQQRTNESGFVICDHCGKPIVKPYDLIAHHVKELDETNVHDHMVSLNPDNVVLVHFKCHNQIHERWQGGNGGWQPKPKQVFIVYGSPCSGKTTWVNDVATKNDLVVDIDSLYECISIAGRYDKPPRLKGVVFQMRDFLYDIVKHRNGKWQNAFVITGGALRGDRERIAKLTGATDLVYIEATKEECVQRLQKRNMNDEQQAAWLGYIEDWFAKFQE